MRKGSWGAHRSISAFLACVQSVRLQSNIHLPYKGPGFIPKTVFTDRHKLVHMASSPQPCSLISNIYISPSTLCCDKACFRAGPHHSTPCAFLLLHWARNSSSLPVALFTTSARVTFFCLWVYFRIQPGTLPRWAKTSLLRFQLLVHSVLVELSPWGVLTF